MLRCLSTLLLPVAWTTATAYKFRPSTYVLFGLCSTLQHVWWSKKRKCDSITPTLRKYLHWLLVHQRVDFKTCLLVYKCLHQLASSSSRHCSLQWRQSSTRRHLRSADLDDLVTPRTRTVRFGPRSFSAAGSSALNSLPSSLTARYWQLDNSLPAEDWAVSTH